MRLVQGMYVNARSCVRVGEGYSEESEVKVGVHQGSVLSPLLFIIVLEALSQEFRSGVPWEDLYADDLVQASFPALSVTLEWAATASSAMAASTGCTRNAEGSSA